MIFHNSPYLVNFGPHPSKQNSPIFKKRRCHRSFGSTWQVKNLGMKFIYGIMLVMLFLTACQNEPATTAELESIQAMETALEQNLNQEMVQELVEKYQQYVQANPDNTEQNAEFLYRAGLLHFRLNRFNVALDYAKEVLKNYFETPASPKAALLMATIYRDKLKNDIGANAVMQGFVKAFPNHEETARIKNNLLAGAPPLEQQIDTLKFELFNEQTGKIEFRPASDYIGVCEIYALLQPDAPQTPEYLHEAGKIAGYIKSYPKALALYDWIYKEYPNSDKAPLALFMMGFTQETELKDAALAKQLYEEFLSKYPSHDFADDAQFLLSNLGKTDDEILKGRE